MTMPLRWEKELRYRALLEMTQCTMISASLQKRTANCNSSSRSQPFSPTCPPTRKDQHFKTQKLEQEASHYNLNFNPHGTLLQPALLFWSWHDSSMVFNIGSRFNSVCKTCKWGTVRSKGLQHVWSSFYGQEIKLELALWMSFPNISLSWCALQNEMQQISRV